jgi:hypothetical protein
MSRKSALVLLLLLGDASGGLHAQLTPPAGSAGAGNSAISGVPFGPARLSPSRVVVPYAGASQRITSPRRVESRRPRVRHRDRPRVSHFTGICRGC